MEEASEEDSSDAESAIAVNHSIEKLKVMAVLTRIVICFLVCFQRGALPLTKTLMRVGGEWRHKEKAVGGRILYQFEVPSLAFHSNLLLRRRPRFPSVHQCTERKKFFGTSGYLPTHDCVVHEKKKRKRFACEVCKMSSAWKSNLNRHRRMLHCDRSHVVSMHGVGSSSSTRESTLTMLLRGRREATERRTRQVKKQKRE